MTEGLLGIAALLALILLRMPIATAMIGVGLVGIALKLGVVPAISLVGKSIGHAGFEYALSIIPLFILAVCAPGTWWLLATRPATKMQEVRPVLVQVEGVIEQEEREVDEGLKKFHSPGRRIRASRSV